MAERLRLPDATSLASKLAELPRERIEEALRGLSDRHALEVLHDWEFWRRDSQAEPAGNWFVWLLLTGRGFGKTRVGAEFARQRAAMYPRGALVGQTVGDIRRVMVEGESGILEKAPPWFRPEWEPSLRKLTWPNGAIALCFSAEEPGELRGPQHYWAWGDEPSEWQYDEAWQNLQIGTRLGPDPRVLLTATPKPVPLIRELTDQHARGDPTVLVTGGTTFENIENLAPLYVERVIRRFIGTRLEAQELLGQLVTDNPDAPLTRDIIERNRIWKLPEGGLREVVVAVDPAGDRGEASAETGIVAGGKWKVGDQWHAVVLQDASLHGSPKEWASEAIRVLNMARGDRIVGEKNYGGDMVESTIKTVDDRVKVTLVSASRGKARRMEPVVSLYEQGLVHHLGRLPRLEDQWCQIGKFDDDALQDRRDANVWLVTELLLEGEPVYGKDYGVG